LHVRLLQAIDEAKRDRDLPHELEACFDQANALRNNGMHDQATELYAFASKACSDSWDTFDAKTKAKLASYVQQKA
jgi:hypothetical protein